MTILKRQREQRKAEKAARKRARRHGVEEEAFSEPVPTRPAVTDETAAERPSEDPAPAEVEKEPFPTR